eukprot:TRINITY_DN12689_c0_g1_i4.p1 TRINITY_DN12689_c0_g1~~TRINITY_DN12689_c0_g1_i4.p1  ORF type:complete len:186 (+),score=26.57 TRINITY_DN12689_c0_g1_i4:62-619(+)
MCIRDSNFMDLILSEEPFKSLCKFKKLKKLIFDDNFLFRFEPLEVLKKLKNIYSLTIINNPICALESLQNYVFSGFEYVIEFNGEFIKREQRVQAKKQLIAAKGQSVKLLHDNDQKENLSSPSESKYEEAEYKQEKKQTPSQPSSKQDTPAKTQDKNSLYEKLWDQFVQSLILAEIKKEQNLDNS